MYSHFQKAERGAVVERLGAKPPQLRTSAFYTPSWESVFNQVVKISTSTFRARAFSDVKQETH